MNRYFDGINNCTTGILDGVARTCLLYTYLSSPASLKSRIVNSVVANGNGAASAPPPATRVPRPVATSAPETSDIPLADVSLSTVPPIGGSAATSKKKRAAPSSSVPVGALDKKQATVVPAPVDDHLDNDGDAHEALTYAKMLEWIEQQRKAPKQASNTSSKATVTPVKRNERDDIVIETSYTRAMPPDDDIIMRFSCVLFSTSNRVELDVDVLKGREIGYVCMVIYSWQSRGISHAQECVREKRGCSMLASYSV